MNEYFTDAEWRKYQSIPEQGYSHRHWLNAHIDKVLAAHDTALLAAQREKDASIAEGHGSASGDVIGDWIRADEDTPAAHPADQQAAERAAEKRYPRDSRRSSGYNGEQVSRQIVFVAGAEWAAAHPATAIDRDKLARWMKRRFGQPGNTLTHWRWQADALLASGVLGNTEGNTP